MHLILIINHGFIPRFVNRNQIEETCTFYHVKNQYTRELSSRENCTSYSKSNTILVMCSKLHSSEVSNKTNTSRDIMYLNSDGLEYHT